MGRRVTAGAPAGFDRRRRPPRRTGAGRHALRAVTIVAAAVAALAVTGRATPVAWAQEPDPLIRFLDAAAADEGQAVIAHGDVVRVADPAADPLGHDSGHDDIVSAGQAWLRSVPAWLLEGPFSCGPADHACSSFGSDASAFHGGALLVDIGLAGTVDHVAPGERREFGVLARLDRFPAAPARPERPADAFAGISHAWIVRLEQGTAPDVFLFVYSDGAFGTFRTHARATWAGNDIEILVPFAGELVEPLAWDAYAYSSDGTDAGTGRDTLRTLPSTDLPDYRVGQSIVFQEAPPSSPTIAPTLVITPAPGGTATPTPSAAGGGGPGATPGGTLGLVAVALGVGLVAWWLLVRRRSRPA